jgi:hypothetical protein
MNPLVQQVLDLSLAWPVLLMHPGDYANLLHHGKGFVSPTSIHERRTLTAHVRSMEIHVDKERVPSGVLWAADNDSVAAVPESQRFPVAWPA